LKGDSAALKGKKVLKSNENSKVFINFVDHGAPGLIAFPSAYLYANDFNHTITYMHENKMYDQLVLYIEACESGSMFDGILSDKINAYAVTAANPTESSWGTYCYPDDVVNGTHINSCLGDLFSVNWLENLESSNPSVETLESQFKKVQVATAQSHVMRYGDLNFTNEVVGDFEGVLDKSAKANLFDKIFSLAKHNKRPSHEELPTAHRTYSSIDTRDALIHHLYAKVSTKRSHKVHLDLSSEVTRRMRVDHVFEDFGRIPDNDVDGQMTERVTPPPRNFDCLKRLINFYEANCAKLQDYDLQYVKYLVEPCEKLEGVQGIEAIESRLKKSCDH